MHLILHRKAIGNYVGIPYFYDKDHPNKFLEDAPYKGNREPADFLLMLWLIVNGENLQFLRHGM